MRAQEFVVESVDADQVLQYVKRAHAPEEFNIEYSITDHPRWELKNIPVSQLKLDPDGEAQDPYRRVNWVDYDKVQELMPRIDSVLKRMPIVVDSQGWIIDGNHRATAAAEAGLKTVPAYVPVAAHSHSNQLNEKINDRVVEPGFTAEKWINGRYLLRAVARKSDDPNDNLRGLIITAHDPETKSSFSDLWGIGMVRFVARQDKQTGDWYLVSSNTSVNEKYQRQGIASAMYQWARELGNDIEPSSNRTDQGKSFWASGAGVGRTFAENFADGKVKGKSRPGRVKRAGASCAGSVSDLRAKAKKYGGERGKMYHWCANMKSGRQKANEAAVGKLTIGPFEIVVDDHSIERAEQRNIKTRDIDNTLRKVKQPRVVKQMQNIDTGSRFYVFDHTNNVALGLRRIGDSKFILKTVYNGRPMDLNIAGIITI